MGHRGALAGRRGAVRGRCARNKTRVLSDIYRVLLREPDRAPEGRARRYKHNASSFEVRRMRITDKLIRPITDRVAASPSKKIDDTIVLDILAAVADASGRTAAKAATQ